MEERGGTQGGRSPLCFVRHTAARRLIEEFSDEPQVAKGVNDRALEHAADGMRSFGDVFVFIYRVMACRSGGHCLAVDGDGRRRRVRCGRW